VRPEATGALDLTTSTDSCRAGTDSSSTSQRSISAPVSYTVVGSYPETCAITSGSHDRGRRTSV